MIECPSCGHDNPGEAKFCQNCGRPLPHTCPNCGASNAAEANFCHNCGHRLAAAESPPPEPRPAVVPPESDEGERRVVTVLFCDVAGSTALGGQLDPEEWTEIMNGMFDYLIAAVTRYDGTIARLMGDAILALFGAPLAHEDDPFRAVLAALDILEDIRPYQEQVRGRLAAAGLEPSPDDLEVRIGINTGLLVVGRVGSEERYEYTAMGDAINMASRMEQMARPGTIQIGHDTYRQIAPLIEVESLGPVMVKGKRGPVLAYRVLGLKAEPGQLRGLEGADSPLAGRARELDLLREARQRLLAGSGQIVCLIGEAGLGKSRLVAEFKAMNAPEVPAARGNPAAARPARLIQVDSLSFEASQPYGLLQRLVRQLAGIMTGEPLPVIRQKIAALAQAVPAGQRSQVSRAMEALFVLDENGAEPPLQGEALKRELVEGMLALTRSYADTPAVLILEDLHWADQASVELIRRLLVLVNEVPLLLLCVFRPDRRAPSWTVKQVAETDCPHRYQEIFLEPLTAGESDILVGNLLKVKELPDRLGELIRLKSDGVPFFVEEIVRELIESGALLPTSNGEGWRLSAEIDDIEIPENLEGVLMARIDRLEDGTRRTLQLAAVIGRYFYYRVLSMVAGSNGRLDRDLISLQQTGMIRETARIPELEYAFRHVLLQEAAYNTILLKRRHAYHKRIAEVMEQLFADNLEEHAPVLAAHFHEAGEDGRALPYSIMAGDNAARLYANEEAGMHYTWAIETAGRIAADAPLLAGLYRKRGLIHEIMGSFDDALADHEAALQIGRAAAESRIEWRALLDLGKLWASRDYDRTHDYFERALTVARRIDDPEIIARSLNRVGNWYTNVERPIQGAVLHKEALAIMEQLQHKAGLADTLDLLGMNQLIAGDIPSAMHYLDRAIDLYRELNDRHGLASSMAVRGSWGLPAEFLGTFTVEPSQRTEGVGEEALKIAQDIGWRSGEAFAAWQHAIRFTAIGQYGQAMALLRDGLRIAEEIEHRQWIAGHRFGLGLVYCVLLAGEQAQGPLTEALTLAREMQSGYWTNLASGTLAWACILTGELDRGAEVLAAVLDEQTLMDSFTKRYCWGRRAQLALLQDDPARALSILDHLIAAIPGATADRPPTALARLRGDALLALERFDEAEASLGIAKTDARLLEERVHLWQIHASLGRLYAATDRQPQAEEEFAAGRSIIAELATNIPDETLRENYLRRAGELLS